uniref:Uncharacterized protein n=1 Tax=Glossina morsitans morsitans TaxID=37546 RepID=A0A1B0FNV2_GLOMM
MYVSLVGCVWLDYYNKDKKSLNHLNNNKKTIVVKVISEGLNRKVGWLAGLLADWLVCWLAGWLAGWQADKHGENGITLALRNLIDLLRLY